MEKVSILLSVLSLDADFSDSLMPLIWSGSGSVAVALKLNDKTVINVKINNLLNNFITLIICDVWACEMCINTRS